MRDGPLAVRHTPTGFQIPKVIHYCWFGEKPISPFLQRCMASWRRIMPEYELRRWDAGSFDCELVPFVRGAAADQKWAFVADYVRLYALHTHGGIYFDTDVQVLRPFDEFLGHQFFTSHEHHPYNFTEAEQAKLAAGGVPVRPDDYITGLNVQASIMGAAAGCPFLKDCLGFYDGQSYLDTAGRPRGMEYVIGLHMSKIAERYGYRYVPTRQYLDGNMVIFEPEVFVGNGTFLTRESYAFHLINGSWTDKSAWEQFVYDTRNRYPQLMPALSLATRVLGGLRRRIHRWLSG